MLTGVHRVHFTEYGHRVHFTEYGRSPETNGAQQEGGESARRAGGERTHMDGRPLAARRPAVTDSSESACDAVRKRTGEAPTRSWRGSSSGVAANAVRRGEDGADGRPSAARWPAVAHSSESACDALRKRTGEAPTCSGREEAAAVRRLQTRSGTEKTARSPTRETTAEAARSIARTTLGAASTEGSIPASLLDNQRRGAERSGRYDRYQTIPVCQSEGQSISVPHVSLTPVTAPPPVGVV